MVAPAGTVSLNLSLAASAGSSTGGSPVDLNLFAFRCRRYYRPAPEGPPQPPAKPWLGTGSAGAYMCLLTGLNANTMQSGVVAVVTVTLSATTSGTSIGIKDALGSSPTGSAISISATGGTITVLSVGLTHS